MVDNDFGTGTAWPRIAHLPEVVLCAEPDNTFSRNAGQLRPEPCCFVVVLINGRPKFILRQFESLGQEFPREKNGVSLEIVTERKITKHLEKSVMPGSMAYVFEVAVLTTRPHALLGCGCPRIGALFLAQEDRFELYHAGVGKK